MKGDTRSLDFSSNETCFGRGPRPGARGPQCSKSVLEPHAVWGGGFSDLGFRV